VAENRITDQFLNNKDRLCQGDILQKIEMVEGYTEEEGDIEISIIKFPRVIVLTQECDLNSDFNNRNTDISSNEDKLLLSVLVAPVYNYDHVIAGNQLDHKSINRKSQVFNKKLRNDLTRNNLKRYHFLKFKDDIIPRSVIDFKHYFSINTAQMAKLKKDNYICSIKEIYREEISQRFSYFLSRIGLPDMISAD